jgi:hypothetical protein
MGILKKAFDKLGKAITNGGSNLAKFNAKKVTERAIRKYHVDEDKAKVLLDFVKNDPKANDLYHDFGVGVKGLARDAAISIATLGVGSIASAAIEAGGAVGSAAQGARIAAAAAKGAQYLDKGSKILKTGISVAAAAKTVKQAMKKTSPSPVATIGDTNTGGSGVGKLVLAAGGLLIFGKKLF